MTLSTCGINGEPHAAAVYFAANEAIFSQYLNKDHLPKEDDSQYPSLYFFSDPSSQHSQDLMINPQAAITIYPETFEWQNIRGLQMRGIVEIIPKGERWEDAWSFYQQKFPFVLSLKPIIKLNIFYQFIPNWLRWLDNRKKLGYKKEWHFK